MRLLETIRLDATGERDLDAAGDVEERFRIMRRSEGLAHGRVWMLVDRADAEPS